MLTNTSLARQAWDIISERGLDKIRCCLTGAPYATLSPDEIIIALEGDIAATPSITIDRLIDNWELRALTFNTQVLPSLRGVKEKALVPFMRRGHEGQVRVLTYMLTRLLYPSTDQSFDSERMRERMLFSTMLYDTAEKWPTPLIMEYVQNLVAIDSFCAMPYWHKLYGFESKLSPMGLWAATQGVQRTFADPMSIASDMLRVKYVIGFMFNLMIYVGEKDGVLGHSGNRLAQNILYLTAPEIHDRPIPSHQKILSQADIDRQARVRALNANPETRIAWSATFGKGNQAGVVKKDRVKAEPSTKKTTPVNASIASAFQAVKADPKFAESLKAMLASKK
jgi:hypothetical protein